jgi:hypothetical protein
MQDHPLAGQRQRIAGADTRHLAVGVKALRGRGLRRAQNQQRPEQRPMD